MGKLGLFDLENHFAFYGAYHSNPVNIFIHMLFVWPILFTSQVILYFTPSLVDISLPNSLVLNYGFLFTVIYAAFYVGMDVKAGSFAGLLCFLCWVFGSFLAHHLGFSVAWKVVLAAQLFCWTGQFIGHGVFEKRAPALLDNLAQAFLMAPFFVLLEALQFSVNYEPYPGFHTRVKAKVDANIKEWKESKQKKSS
ncbi:2-hydroxy-palmitic acid dioxygenase MPO1 [Rutidosis leptorrhynchoides]|uniref:2-hydroxy-palmitic acid dioxygenase MPO1 n=1 Tax=Rutidosis leptorrhynchoides TaxID=125765 RepID=UPI003A99BFA1